MRFSLALQMCFIALNAVAASTLAAQENSDESTKIQACRVQLDACVRAAEAPESIGLCSEQDARCIADAMQVSVPDGTSVGTLTQCAADATDCTFFASTTEQFDECATSLARCIDGVVASELTCTERWTQCVQDQPFLLPICSLELLGCQDP
jgi:hypothetical protein